MSNEVSTRISPEGIEIANSYLEAGNVDSVSRELAIPKDEVVDYLNKREVKKYIDSVYLDAGYRNKFKLASVLDAMIEKKLEEAEESDMYTSKDLADLVLMAHKMRMDEVKAQTEMEKVSSASIKTQNNVLIQGEGAFGQGNYGALIEKLINSPEV
jgi:hypothetical protein|tara:strand:- start:113 stop:580 length:468 start_codon:yes stop_codon:yes gene_type:complete